MINNPVLQGDMHSDTIIWREREEPEGTEFLCNLFISQVCSAVQAVWKLRPTAPAAAWWGSSGSLANLNPASMNSHPQKLDSSW